jgi:lysophospholipase L1-like esterase
MLADNGRNGTGRMRAWRAVRSRPWRRAAVPGAVVSVFATLLPAAQPQPPPPEPRVGVLPDPCFENPDTWRGNAWAWRSYDFGQLCQYRLENARLPPASAARAVFIGDSITESWRGADPQLFTNDTLNRGISGQTSEQMLVRFRADVIELKPRVVHIMAGINDVAGNNGPTSLAIIEGNIRTMVEQALLHHIRVVLATIPPSARIPWRTELEHPAETIATINKWLRDYAQCEHLVFADYTTVLGDPRGGIKPGLSTDGVHPSPAGYAAMTPLARAALARAMVQPAPAASAPSPGCGENLPLPQRPLAGDFDSAAVSGPAVPPRTEARPPQRSKGTDT